MIFYLLDKNEKIIRMLPTNRCDFSVQELNLNGIYILNFDIDIKDLWIMENIEYIIHKDIENKENFYMYKIITWENNKDRLEFKAIYIAMDELESYSYITDKKPKNVKVSQAVNIVISNTRWELGEIDDSVVKSLNFYYCSPLKAITKIIDVYNVEIDFRLKAEKNRIVKRLIDVKKQVGKFTGKRFFYGTNALEVIKETNNGSIYTKFIPRGRGEEVGDGFGRRIDIKDIVWSKSKGDPIDKPKGQEYIEFEDMTALYGHSDGTPRSTIVPFENIDDPNELIKAAYNYGLVNSRPQMSYKSDVERIGRINLGDGVLIIRKDLNIRYVARVYKIIKDLKNPNKTKVELGDNRDISQSKKNMDFQKKLENLNEKLGETNINFVKKIQEGLTETMYNQESYRYEAVPGDDSGLLSGTWYFNKPIDKNPDKALYLGGGHIAMANKKDSNSNWEFTTIANGDGVIANTIVAGVLKGGKVRWNLEDGTLLIGENTNNYNLFWDGGTLHLRNTNIDLSNNVDIDDMKKSISLKVSRGDIISEINQSPEQVKIKASKIDLEGSSVNIKGTFQTLNSDDDVGIKIDYNQIHFQDNRRQGYRFGMINVNKLWYKDRAFSLNLGHYQEGFLSVGWYKDDWKEWEPYIVFDRWGKSTYATEGYSIRVLDTINFDKTALFKGNVVINRSTTFNDECKFERNITFGGNRIKIVNYSDGLGFVNGNGEGLFIEESGAVYLMDTQYKYRVAKE